MSAAAAAAGCLGATVDVRPDAKALSANVSAVAQLPIDVDYGTPAERRRAQRRAGDTLIALSGGHAILADELRPGGDATEFPMPDQQIADRVRALGEPPEHVLTFALLASRSKRKVANGSAIPGFATGRRLIIDYTVRLEVRQAGRSEVIGPIDTVAAAEPNRAEIGSHGESLGLQKAIDEALVRAVRTFAPGLVPRTALPAPAPSVVEVPATAAAAPLKRLQALQDLYPELSIDQIQLLSGSRDRYLVLDPGPLAALGLIAGDLFDAPAGQTLPSRATLARTLARRTPIKLVVTRAGQRYLMASD
jgi:hypothetical protein